MKSQWTKNDKYRSSASEKKLTLQSPALPPGPLLGTVPCSAVRSQVEVILTLRTEIPPWETRPAG